jgi:hypothetical protein
MQITFPPSHEITKPPSPKESAQNNDAKVLTVYFGTPNMFITLWFGFFYGTNPTLGTLII